MLNQAVVLAVPVDLSSIATQLAAYNALTFTGCHGHAMSPIGLLPCLSEAILSVAHYACQISWVWVRLGYMGMDQYGQNLMDQNFGRS